MQFVFDASGCHCSNHVLLHGFDKLLEQTWHDVVIKPELEESLIVQVFLSLLRSPSFIVFMFLYWDVEVLRVVRIDLCSVDFDLHPHYEQKSEC